MAEVQYEPEIEPESQESEYSEHRFDAAFTEGFESSTMEQRSTEHREWRDHEFPSLSRRQPRDLGHELRKALDVQVEEARQHSLQGGGGGGEPPSRSPSKLSVTLADVPVGRGLELDRRWASLGEQLHETHENLRILNGQIAKSGGRLVAPLNLLRQEQAESTKARRLDQERQVLQGESHLQARYEIELCAYALLRAELGFMNSEEPVRHEEVLSVSEEVLPALFNSESLLLGMSPGRLAAKFEQEELIDNEIERLKPASHYDDAKLLQYRLDSLMDAKREFGKESSSPSGFPSVTRIDPSLHDSGIPGHIIDFDSSDGEWAVRISVHRFPSAGQQESPDAIVLRELLPGDRSMLNTTTKRRMAIIYYRPRSETPYSLEIHPDMMPELRSLRGRLCPICEKQPCDETTDYRLPNCMLFLRFFDQSEQLKDPFKGKRVHIPVCKVVDATQTTDDHEVILDEDSELYNRSVPDWTFGELFKREMVGSYWLGREEITTIYEHLKSDGHKGVGFIIHSLIHRPQNDRADE